MVKNAVIIEVACSPDEQRLHSRRERCGGRIKLADVLDDASLVSQRLMAMTRLIASFAYLRCGRAIRRIGREGVLGSFSVDDMRAHSERDNAHCSLRG